MEIWEKQREAIRAINPDAKFVIRSSDLDTIEWHDGTPPIAKSDIEAKMLEVENKYNADEYKRKRLNEYPMLEECIHALLDGGETLENLQALRKSVKEKYPKD
jgi:hypothetical protein